MPLKNPFKTTKAGRADRRILIVCILLCAAGICYAVWVSHAPLDAPRGSVLALGLTLAFVVSKSESASQVYDALQKIAKIVDPPAQSDNYAAQIEALKKKVTDLEDEMKSLSADEKRMNWYLVWATGIATVVSAFGDIGSVWIMHLLGITPVK